MAGITIVNIYAATIFENIVKEGGTMFVRVPTAGIFIGVSGFIGAFFSNFTVYYFSRRGVFIGGNLLMLIFLLITAISIRIKNGNLSLLCICFLVISYQASTGSAFWIYTTEIGQDAAMGLCLFTKYSTTPISLCDSICQPGRNRRFLLLLRIHSSLSLRISLDFHERDKRNLYRKKEDTLYKEGG